MDQCKFYPRFDHVVLLSAPIEVILERIATRDTDLLGKSAEEREFGLHWKTGTLAE